MPIPVAQAGSDQSFAYSASAVLVTLAGAATNTPITAWRWTMLSVPSGSSADSGSNQDFTDGVASVQNPQFDMDVPGCYVLQLEAQNAIGWSSPEADKEGGQTLCFMRTQQFDLEIPGYAAYRYDPYLNGTLNDMEAGLADHSARHENGGADEISVAGLSGALADPQTPATHASSHQNGGADEVATATPAANAIPKAGAGGDLDGGWMPYGTGASTVCEGNDSRLSDARTPTSHASSHQNGGGDEISVAGLSGELADPQPVKTHASSHQNGGGDEVATATPGANAIPKADGSNKLDIGWSPTAAPGATGVATASAEGSATTLARSDHAHQSNTAPADVTKAAAAIGTSGEPARADHKHDVSTATAGAATPGDSAAEGSATSLARSDHQHSLPAFGTGSGTFCEGDDSRLSDARKLATPVTAQASTPLSLTAADSGKVYTNDGAAAQIVFNLPTAAANLNYTFIVQDADGIQIVAASGDTIRVAASATPAAGNISTTTVGNTVQLIAINDTEWIAVYYVGTWTVSS